MGSVQTVRPSGPGRPQPLHGPAVGPRGHGQRQSAMEHLTPGSTHVRALVLQTTAAQRGCVIAQGHTASRCCLTDVKPGRSISQARPHRWALSPEHPWGPRYLLLIFDPPHRAQGGGKLNSGVSGQVQGIVPGTVLDTYMHDRTNTCEGLPRPFPMEHLIDSSRAPTQQALLPSSLGWRH